MKIIDAHVHFPLEEKTVKENKIVHPWIEKDKEKWRNSWGFPKPLEINDTDELIEKWYNEAIKYDLEKIIFVTSGGNDIAVKIIKTHPDKFIAYAHHDPSIFNAADILENYINLGLRGYKILGPSVKTPLNDKSLYPIWETAQYYEIPVLIHFGIMGGAGGIAYHQNINPLIIHDVAKNFPHLNIIIPHFGCGYVFETLNLCWACPNVFIDTSGSNQWMRWMPYEINLENLFRKYFETIGPERIIFGTDSSWFPRGFTEIYLKEQIKAMLSVGFNYDDLDKVLYKNIKLLLSKNLNNQIEK